MRDWLKKKRLEHGLTQKQVAEKIGLKESYYAHIEKGDRKKKMDAQLVKKLSDLFAIPMEEIVELEMEGKQ